MGAVMAAGVLALYVVLVGWLTWPLAIRMTTHLPNTHPACNFDALHAAWVLAFQSRALTSAPLALRGANDFHPAHATLCYGDTASGALPLFLPTFLLTGNPALALNVTFLASVALTAWTLHLVVRWWTGSHLAGVLAAWTFLTARWTLWEFVPTAPGYAVLLYFPLLIFVAAEPAARFSRALRLLPLVVLQSLSCLAYLAAAVFAPLGLLAVGRVMRRATRAAGVRLLGVLACALVVLAPFAACYLAVRLENPRLGEQTYWRWWHPATALPWGLLGYQVPTAVPLGALVLIAVGGLSVVRGWRHDGRVRPAWVHGAFWTAAGVFISLTPTATWYGRPIRLPQTVLAGWVPIYDVLREPARLGVGALMGLAILSGAAFAECAAWLAKGGRRPWLARFGPALLAALVALEMHAEYRRGVPAFLHEPLPSSYPLKAAIRPDSPIVRILQTPGGPLLELPVGLQPGLGCVPGLQARALYRSIFHWRPLLNGYSGYWPAGFLERMALAERLPDAAALRTLRSETGLELVLVHASDLPPAERAVWLGLAERGDDRLTLVARDGEDLLFTATARSDE